MAAVKAQDNHTTLVLDNGLLAVTYHAQRHTFEVQHNGKPFLEVLEGTIPRLSNPRQMFLGVSRRLGMNHGYDVEPGARRFVTVQTGDIEKGSGDLVLVTGWDPEADRSR